MDNNPIGIFDSALGGLTAVKEIEKVLPKEDIVYFGDTGRVPYGTKSALTINKYTAQNVAFLKTLGVKVILAACGTVSAVAQPNVKDCGVPYFDVIEPTVEAAIKSTKSGRIGVIATPTTVASHAYTDRILGKDKDIEVFELACPLFVNLIESGHTSSEDEITRFIVEKSLEDMRLKNVDTLVLGCTHFPIIADTISEVVGSGVKLINSGREAARELARFLQENDILNESGKEAEKSFFVSDNIVSFSNTAEIFLGHSIEGMTKRIHIEDY